jgi:hypothetical protein
MTFGERIIEVLQTVRAELDDDELGKRLGLLRRLLDAHDVTINRARLVAAREPSDFMRDVARRVDSYWQPMPLWSASRP